MGSPFDNPLGLSANLLPLREQRLKLIAANLANADTPGYKARDLDFQAAMQAATGEQSNGMLATHSRHIGVGLATNPANLTVERASEQPSLDGNTVNAETEHAAYARATLEYRASLGFVEARLRGLLTAITGQ